MALSGASPSAFSLTRSCFLFLSLFWHCLLSLLLDFLALLLFLVFPRFAVSLFAIGLGSAFVVPGVLFGNLCSFDFKVVIEFFV